MTFIGTQQHHTIVTDRHNQKYRLGCFVECISVSNVIQVRRKTVPGGWTGAGKTTFSIRPQPVSAVSGTDCRNAVC